MSAPGGFAAQNRREKVGMLEMREESDRSRPTETTEGRRTPGPRRGSETPDRTRTWRGKTLRNDKSPNAEGRRSDEPGPIGKAGREQHLGGPTSDNAERTTSHEGGSRPANRDCRAARPPTAEQVDNEGKRCGQQPPTSHLTVASRRFRTEPGKAGTRRPRTAAVRWARAKVARSGLRKRTPRATPGA